jgi:hypothetical protein
MERLLNKNWVEKSSETPRGTQICIARPICNQFLKLIISAKFNINETS